MKNTLVLALTLLTASAWMTAPQAHAIGEASEAKESILRGPSFHVFFGARMKKAPDLDTFSGPIGGMKLSPFGMNFGQNTYLSLLVPGVGYIGDNKVALSISPFIAHHTSGLGFSFDFFTTRQDRQGGPLGFSMNLDVIQLVNFVQNFGK